MKEIRINSYNSTLLQLWEANMDLQYVLDANACAVYIVSYISKGQRGMSTLLKQACTEAREGNMQLKKQVQLIGNRFLKSVEISAQEAAFLLLQLQLRRSSRKVTFIMSCPPDSRIYLLREVEQLEKLPGKSTDVTYGGDIYRYAKRPKCLENMCLADFVAWYEYRSGKENKKNRDVTDAESFVREDYHDEQVLDEELSKTKIKLWGTSFLQKNFGKNFERYCTSAREGHVCVE